MAIGKENSIAMTNYAMILENGEGVPVNKKEAAKYYKISADKGCPTAMFNLATMFEEGECVPVNKEEAVKYYKLSDDCGDKVAMYAYGSLVFLVVMVSLRIKKKESLI